MSLKPTAKHTGPLYYDLFVKLLPSLLVNLFFIIQAIQLQWNLGTMIWIYWLQGLLMILLGILASKMRFGWYALLGIMAFYGIFLIGLTFPSEYATYLKNGVEVSAEEFTVLSNTQWNYVFVNVLLLLAGYLYSQIIRKDTSAYSAAHVVKRLIPLHMTIILASFLSWSVLFFLILRSIFDIVTELTIVLIKRKHLTH